MAEMRVRYDGPAQGLGLFRHAVHEADLTITGAVRSADDPTPAGEVVSVLFQVVAADGSDDETLPLQVRAMVAQFAARYHRAGLDIVDG